MCERAPHIIVCYGEKLKYEREKSSTRRRPTITDHRGKNDVLMVINVGLRGKSALLWSRFSFARGVWCA